MAGGLPSVGILPAELFAFLGSTMRSYCGFETKGFLGVEWSLYFGVGYSPRIFI